MTLYVRHEDGTLSPCPLRLSTWPPLTYVEIDDDAHKPHKPHKPYSPPKFKVGDRIRMKAMRDHIGVVTDVSEYLYTIVWPRYGGAPYSHTNIDRFYELAPPEPTFKVGDRVLNTTSPERGVVTGVHRGRDGGWRYTVETSPHSTLTTDECWLTPARPLEDVLLDWEYGSHPYRRYVGMTGTLRALAERLRNAFPEAGL